MSIKKFWKNTKSKQTIMGAVILVLIICIVGTSIMIVPLKADDGPFEPADSGDYDYSKKVTISNTYIDASLTNFPVLVHDNTGTLKDNITADANDIAFFAVGNETQYNHEIEKYDSGTGELWAWVNITSVSDGADTVFYMYYGDSDGDYTVGHNPTSVWDGYYDTVYHMNDNTTGTVNDSTANKNHGIKDAANHPIEVTSGKIGNCQNFDGSQDWIRPSVNFSVDNVSFTISAWVKANTTGDITAIATRDSSHFDGKYYGVLWKIDVDAEVAMTRETGTSSHYLTSGTEKVLDMDMFYTNMVFNKSTGFYGIYVNGTLDNSEIETTDDVGYGSRDMGWYIGASIVTATPLERYWLEGKIDEFRVSTTNRNASWIKASYHSQNETPGFLTLSEPTDDSEPSSTYSLKGLPSSNVTWAGIAGTTVYCNATGYNNEWLEINMSINSSQNVTEIRVFMDDLNDTNAYINASNITMYVSSDNSSYGELGTFLDGGSNMTINASTWNSGTMGTDPFAGAGLTDKNASIWCVFKMEIPVGLSTDIFYSSTYDSCKVYILH